MSASLAPRTWEPGPPICSPYQRPRAFCAHLDGGRLKSMMGGVPDSSDAREIAVYPTVLFVVYY